MEFGILQQLDKQSGCSSLSDSVLLSNWPTRAGQRLGWALWVYLQMQSVSAVSHCMAPVGGIMNSKKGQLGLHPQLRTACVSLAWKGEVGPKRALCVAGGSRGLEAWEELCSINRNEQPDPS